MVHLNYIVKYMAAGFFIVETGFLDKTKNFKSKIRQKLESMKEPKNVYNSYLKHLRKFVKCLVLWSS